MPSLESQHAVDGTTPAPRGPIPFNKPAMVGREFEEIHAALSAGYVAGGGQYSKRVETFLGGVAKRPALLTTSCTHALEMSALLLDIGPGDEVIVPSYAFVSCANAFALRGARIVFADVDARTFNISAEAIESALTSRTRAVVIIHYGGVACDIDGIRRVLRDRDVAIVEDNAHGLFGTYRGEPLGSFGRFTTLSFHETKNVHCGEGGALLVDRQADLERAEILREKGTNRAAFFRGQVDKYRWVDLGSSYVISDILAAYLFAQVERWEAVQRKRAHIWHRYDDELREVCARNAWAQPLVPDYAGNAYHLYFIVLESAETRADFIDYLKGLGIQAVFHYQSLHRSPFAIEHGLATASCPNADLGTERLVRLPFFYDLTDDEQTYIVDAVIHFGRSRD